MNITAHYHCPHSQKSTIAAKDMFRTFITCESCCFCCWWWCYWTIWTNARKKAKKTKSPQNKTMKERDKVHIGVIMRFSDFICLSVVRTFVRWWLRWGFFVCVCVCGLSNGFFTYAREKKTNTSFHFSVISIFVYIFLLSFADGSLTYERQRGRTHIWTQSNILCAYTQCEHDS